MAKMKLDITGFCCVVDGLAFHGWYASSRPTTNITEQHSSSWPTYQSKGMEE
jgi:hypothetical protein